VINQKLESNNNRRKTSWEDHFHTQATVTVLTVIPPAAAPDTLIHIPEPHAIPAVRPEAITAQ
jgi:hypothetical protein